MSKELVSKKLRQMGALLEEMESFLGASLPEFIKTNWRIRSSERNLLLLVELASDINAHIIAELGSIRTPETYKESFREVERLEIIPPDLSKELMDSAELRNILIHEYDFDQDNLIFYKSVKKFLISYKRYVAAIQEYCERTYAEKKNGKR